MKKNLFNLILIVAAITSAVTACVRNDFRYYGYEDQLEGYFPVDSIENGHKWNLIKTCTSFVKGKVADAAMLQVLSDNPFTTSNVEVFAEAPTTSNISRQVYYVAPEAQSTIYVAVLDKNGKYLRMTKATPSQGTIEIDSNVPTGTAKAVIPQKIFYCFVADYPNPSETWDYNDVVMSVTKEILDDKTTVALHVSLDAVGYLKQIGAAIRLVGYSYNQYKDIISKEEGATFLRYPERERKFISKDEWQDVGKSLTNEVVINLFDDAHLAMYKLAEDGSVYRRYFNTIANPSSTNQGAIQPAVTVTYYLKFSDEFVARSFSLNDLDPFIVVQYGTTGENYWEVHTYPYKLAEVLYPYYNGASQSYNNGFSWALAIPYAKFRYPLEGTTIGELKKNIISGAYQELGHSFGEWILNHNNAQDWYLYPADGAIY